MPCEGGGWTDTEDAVYMLYDATGDEIDLNYAFSGENVNVTIEKYASTFKSFTTAVALTPGITYSIIVDKEQYLFTVSHNFPIGTVLTHNGTTLHVTSPDGTLTENDVLILETDQTNIVGVAGEEEYNPTVLVSTETEELGNVSLYKYSKHLSYKDSDWDNYEFVIFKVHGNVLLCNDMESKDLDELSVNSGEDSILELSVKNFNFNRHPYIHMELRYTMKYQKFNYVFIDSVELGTAIAGKSVIALYCSGCKGSSQVLSSPYAMRSYLFDNCRFSKYSSFFNSAMSIPVGNLQGLVDITSQLNISGLFYYCYALEKVKTFDTSKASNLGSLFYACYSLKQAPMLDTKTATQMGSMFYFCYVVWISYSFFFLLS